MIDSTGTHRVTFIILRYMRRPILVLVSVYSISMVGWVMIPGVGTGESAEPLSFFHAFYFLTYTATTTGFGEIPAEFSDAQRRWSIVSLYGGVIAWLYAVGSIIGLLQNPHFRGALAQRRFARLVARIREPFVIICGFGSTGSLLARGLSEAGVTGVVLDTDKDRINALNLRDYRVSMPGLCANARVPARLCDAGLRRANCRAVVALTGDEEVNLKIAVTARLLNPGVEVITHSTSEAHEETLASLGKDVHIVDPFHTFARYLGATIDNPGIYVLNRWLAGDRGANLDGVPDLPRGTWVLCGYGRMGRNIREALNDVGVETIVIDPHSDGAIDDVPDLIAARASQATLAQAGVERAAGLVAGTDDDAYNLSIVLNARALNAGIFIIVRQDLHMNEILYAQAGAQIIMQPSLVSARRILFELIAPLLKPLFEHLRGGDDRVLLQQVLDELRARVGSKVAPRLWTVDVTPADAPALAGLLANGARVALADILRNPVARDEQLAVVPLVVRSGETIEVMPDGERALQGGDQILLCGRDVVHRTLEGTLHNEYTLRYLITGVDEPRGYFMRWLSERRLRARRESVATFSPD